MSAQATTKEKVTRWLLVGPGRCGSNWLVSALRENSEVRIYGEVFNTPGAWDGTSPSLATMRAPDKNEDGGQYLASQVYGKQLSNIASIGCKVFYQHPNGPHVQAWDWANRERIRILCLRRKNWVNWYISLKLAIRENRWLGFNHEQARYRNQYITVDPEAMVGRIRKMQELESDVLSRLSSCPLMVVDYEDLQDDFNLRLSEVQQHIGIKQQVCNGSTVRQRIIGQRQSVQNWHEMAMMVNKHPDLRCFLEADD